MIALRWFTRQALYLLGWQGFAGIGLIVASIVFAAGIFTPLQGRVAQLKADTPSAYARQNELKRIAVEQNPAVQLEKFYRFFANDDPLTDWLGRLYSIGDAYNIKLRQAEYRAMDDRNLKLNQYQIVLPVTATYPQLKQFLAAVLTEIPILSLDYMSLQRRKVGDSTVDVQLQFTLYLPEKS